MKKLLKPAQQKWLIENVKVIVTAGLIALSIRSLAFEPFHIPSSSMEPTLLVGDYIFVSKYSYGYSRYSFPFSPKIIKNRIFLKAPKRGDVVVFRLPKDPSIDYIKRVVGLPGDKIQVKKSILYINGKVVPRDPISSGSYPVYMENLPDTTQGHLMLDLITNAPLDNTPVFTVPEGHFFAMGDNRDNSLDSRAPDGGVGYVPFENLVGHARIIFFSVERPASWNPADLIRGIRKHRLFRKIY